MRRVSVLLLLSLIGCSSNSTGDDTTGPDAGGGDDAPPFTNGTSTLAGSSAADYVDGSRAQARFNNPVNVAFHDGKVYVADFDNNKLRVVDADGTTGTVIAQQGFGRPFAMTFSAAGILYVTTDKDEHGVLSDMSGSVWKIDIAGKKATIIANAIGRPRGLAVLPNGKLAVADYTHHVIQILDPTSGVLTPLAGTWAAKGMVDGLGAAARFSTPYSLAVNAQGMLVVTDFENNRIRLVGLDGAVSTLAGVGTAGFADGAMTTAKFNHPQGLTIDTAGDLFITDSNNFRVRRISGANVTTIAGSGIQGYADSDDNLAAQFYGLEGLSVSPDGAMVYVADGTRGEDVPYNRVRQIIVQ